MELYKLLQITLSHIFHSSNYNLSNLLLERKNELFFFRNENFN